MTSWPRWMAIICLLATSTPIGYSQGQQGGSRKRQQRTESAQATVPKNEQQERSVQPTQNTTYYSVEIQETPRSTPPPSSLLIEVEKGIVTFLILIVSGGVTALLWAFVQKRRELQLSAGDKFYEIYGEVMELLRVWRGLRPMEGRPSVPASEPIKTRWDLYLRACAVEGKVEGFLARLASQQELSTQDVRTLGRFRQSCQILRQHIRDDQPIQWATADALEYATFKKLSCDVFALSMRIGWWPIPADRSSQALANLMSNYWENSWKFSEREFSQWTTQQKEFAAREKAERAE